MKFSYVALGQDNQKITGMLEASSLEMAQEELHKINLSIITLNEIRETIASEEHNLGKEKEKNEIITYYFVGTDPQGKEVNGTIDSNDAYQAYKRLTTEYKFDLLDLEVYQSAEGETTDFKSNFDIWAAKLRQEGFDPNLRHGGSVKNELADEGEEMAEEIVTEIDHFILSTKKIIEEHGQQYSKTFLQKIESKLGNLERIRSSNNLNHITKVCNELYELIARPDLNHELDADTAEGQAYKNMLKDLKESGFVQKKRDFLEAGNLKNKVHSFEGIKGIFSKINHQLTQESPRVETYAKESSLDEAPLRAMSVSHSFSEILIKYLHYFKERNPILKRARKQEFDRAWRERKAFKESLNANKKNFSGGPTPLGKKDFSNFFMELNSFVGWLLFFYLSYFFLVSFSLERNVGLSQELVVKTLSSPLVINICIFLLLAHLAITLKIRLFKQNFIGTTFLFFFSLSLYMVLLANL